MADDVVECSRCGQTKPPVEFAKLKRNKIGQLLPSVCRVCQSEVQRVIRLKKLFDLTPEEYNKIFSYQGGVCFVCKQPPKKQNLSVDHDHKTGLVRGLLCSFCNRGIGVFRDNLQKFELTVQYLKDPPATLALGSPKFGLKGRVTNKAATRKKLNSKKNRVG